MLSKKMMTGIAAITIMTSLGMGTAYASLNAGDQLRSWYTSTFNQSTAKVEQGTVEVAELKMNEFVDELLDTQLQMAKTLIDETLSSTLLQASTDLSQHELAYINQMEAAEQELFGLPNKSGQIESRFTAFVASSKDAIDEELENHLGQFLDELTLP